MNQISKKWIKIFICISILFVALAGWYKYLSINHTIISSVAADYKTEYFSSETTLTMVSALVWYHSRGKLHEIRGILLDSSPLKNVNATKLKIENMLRHRSGIYIRQLNQYHTPITNLGRWYDENFDFKNFIKDVYTIVFRDIDSKQNKLYQIEMKIQEIRDIMEKYQNLTNDKLKQTLRGIKA
jgi:hypothetical protein